MKNDNKIIAIKGPCSANLFAQYFLESYQNIKDKRAKSWEKKTAS